jgi:hypothetical protein
VNPADVTSDADGVGTPSVGIVTVPALDNALLQMG